MKALVLVLQLAMPMAEGPGVEVRITTEPQVTACPSPGPTWGRNKDGSYTKLYPTTSILLNCMSLPSCRVQQWTATPTEGGRFIRDLGPCETAEERR